MASAENVLIVEDEEEWRNAYQRAVSGRGSGQTVKMAKDFASAERWIEEIKFAVAFVDVSLDEKNDRNADGLRVMEKIRETGDETSIVVVTGRRGKDVVSITRDAIKKYGAYDTFDKSSVTPSDIRGLLAGGLEAYRKAAEVGPKAVREVLRGKVHAPSWDDQVMRATRFKGDAGRFYGFLSELLGEYLPVVSRRDDQPASIESSTGLVHGEYWSRATGAGIVVCFGAADQFDQAMEAAAAEGKLLGRYQTGLPAKEVAAPGVKGAVFPLEGYRRENFGGNGTEPPEPEV